MTRMTGPDCAVMCNLINYKFKETLDVVYQGCVVGCGLSGGYERFARKTMI